MEGRMDNGRMTQNHDAFHLLVLARHENSFSTVVVFARCVICVLCVTSLLRSMQFVVVNYRLMVNE